MSVTDYLSKQYREHKELVLLEWTYFGLAVVSIVIAGVLALFNQALGISVLIVPLIALIAMSTNVVAWALVKLAMETFLPKKSDDSQSAKKK